MIKLGGKEIEWTRYPNGEVGLHDLDLDSSQQMMTRAPIVKWSWENDGELIKLLFLKRLMDDHFFDPGTLIITYMPYSRMDRTPNGEAFTLKYVAEFINSMNWHHVRVVEPHSDVTMALLDRSSAYYPIKDLFPDQIQKEIDLNIETDYLVFPDAGAEKRYGKMFPGYQTITMSKTRDFATGQITGLHVNDADSIKLAQTGSKALIIDDLCSKGGTFRGATDALFDVVGMAKVYLYITHCEAAIFDGTLLDHDGPNHIFTTDAFPTARMPTGWPINKSDKITVYPI